jgi:hypothetical protein
MNASHTSNVRPSNLHSAGAAPARSRRIVLLVLYAALVAQLAVWSVLASRVGLTAFTQHVHGGEANVVVGGAVWLVVFTISVVGATIRYRQDNR